MPETEKRAAYIQGLRELALFLEENPELPVPWEKNFSQHCWKKEDFQHNLKLLGSCEKDYSSDYYVKVFKTFGALKYGFQINREAVCTRKVTGTRIVAAEPEYVIPAKPERVEQIVEWKCGSFLAPEKEDTE